MWPFNRRKKEPENASRYDCAQGRHVFKHMEVKWWDHRRSCLVVRKGQHCVRCHIAQEG